MRAMVLVRPISWRNPWGRTVLHNPGIARLPLLVAAAAIQAGVGIPIDNPEGEALQRRVLAGEALVTGRRALAADRVVHLGDLSRPRRRAA